MVAMMMENPAEKKVRGWLGKVDQHTKEEKEKDRGNIYRTGVLACASLLPCFLAFLVARCCAGSRAELAAMKSARGQG
jgi:transposase